MERIGFIGLGVMGSPMALNIKRSGYEVLGLSRTVRNAGEIESSGIGIASSIAELTDSVDVIITMLPDSPDVESAVLGNQGVLANSRVGQLLIDCSTIRPQMSQRINAAARDLCVGAIDAPVSGGERGAIEATLSIMVGGQEADFTRAEPILNAMGKTVKRVGGDGAGQTVKAANQLLVAGNIALVAEAIVFLEASSVDIPSAINVLRGGLAGSRVLDIKTDAMLARNFTPGFRIDLHHKDMGIVIDAIRANNLALPLTGLIAQLVASAKAQGYGSLDHGALLKLMDGLSHPETK